MYENEYIYIHTYICTYIFQIMPYSLFVDLYIQHMYICMQHSCIDIFLCENVLYFVFFFDFHLLYFVSVACNMRS